jgi:thiamine pyridinylase
LLANHHDEQQAVMQASIAPRAVQLSYLFPARTKRAWTRLERARPALPANVRHPEQCQDNVNWSACRRPTATAFHSFGGSVRGGGRGALQRQLRSGKHRLFRASNAEAPVHLHAALRQSAGGWVGSWTNQSPPAWPGYSACGCNTCIQASPLPQSVQEEEATTMVQSGPALKRYMRN